MIDETGEPTEAPVLQDPAVTAPQPPPPEQPAAPAPVAAPAPPEFDAIPIGGAQIMVQRGASQEAIQNAIQHHMTTPEFYAGVDKNSGGPYRWRKAVGDAIRPDDKLKTLRKFAPDAMPFDDDNFVYTDKETGQVKLFNPKGFDTGDVFGAAREISVAAGSTLGSIYGFTGGTIVGLPLGPGALATGTGGAIAGAGWGASATAGLYDYLSQQFGETERSESVLSRTADLAVEGLTAASGQRVGDIVLPALTGAVKKMLGGGTQKAQDIYNSLVKHGVTPTAGAVTGGKGAGRLESALDQTLAAATTMREQINSVVITAQEAVEKLSTQVGKAKTQQGAGLSMQEAAESALTRFTKDQGILEQKLADKIGPDAPFSVDNMRALHTEMAGLAADMPKFSKKAYGEIMEVLSSTLDDAATNGGAIPYSAFRKIRTYFGEKMADMTEGVNRSSYKRLYGAMTDDLEAGADARGLGDMFKKTVEFTKNFKQEFDDVLNKLVDFDAPERGYRFLLNSRRDGGTYFSKLQEQFKPDEWADVSATILQKMGHKNFGNEADDAFSVNTFISNWHTIADEAKTVLFKGVPDGKALRANMDELVTVFRSISDSARLGNASNTAGAAHTMQLMDALGGDFTKLALAGLAIGGQPAMAVAGLATTVAGKVITPHAVSKLITNPAFVKWLAGGPSVRTGAEVGQHMGRLLSIYQANPMIRGALDEFIAKLENPPAEPDNE